MTDSTLFAVQAAAFLVLLFVLYQLIRKFKTVSLRRWYLSRVRDLDPQYLVFSDGPDIGMASDGSTVYLLSPFKIEALPYKTVQGFHDYSEKLMQASAYDTTMAEQAISQVTLRIENRKPVRLYYGEPPGAKALAGELARIGIKRLDEQVDATGIM